MTGSLNEWGQLFAGIGTTIGVCVWLLKAQQKERERQEERSEKRIDQMFKLLDDNAKETNEIQRELTSAIQGLNEGFRSIDSRLQKIEKTISGNGGEQK